MPTASATSCIDVPAKPLRRNRSVDTSRICRQRASASVRTARCRAARPGVARAAAVAAGVRVRKLFTRHPSRSSAINITNGSGELKPQRISQAARHDVNRAAACTALRFSCSVTPDLTHDPDLKQLGFEAFLEPELDDLGGRHRPFIDDPHVARHLEAGDATLAKIDQVVRV